MTLKDQTTSDLSVLFDTNECAETITYAGSDIPAIINHKSRTAASIAQKATITVRTSDVASPAYRDAVVIDGETWRVTKEVIESGADGVWTIFIERDKRPDII